MITLERISPIDLLMHIHKAFEGDADLLNNIHMSPGSLDHCVNHTYAEIEKSAHHYGDKMDCFKVMYGFQNIGYSVIIRHGSEPDELYSYGISIKYRESEILKEWMELLKDTLSNPFFTVLWSKNERAIKFFEKNGLYHEKGWEDPGKDKTLLVYRNNEC